MKNQKGFVNIVLVVIIVLLVGAVGYFALVKKPTLTQPPAETQGIVVEQPILNQEVQLPITVKGYVNGNGWAAFEGVAGSVQVFDVNNKAVSERVPLQATTDWMKPMVNFETMVGDRQMMSNLETLTGYLLFRNDNPKGDPNDDKELRLPIKFAQPTAQIDTLNWKTYTNSQYGFLITLPDSWKGYTVLNSQWEGWNIDPTKGASAVIDHGPIITFRHPDWTEANQREDMPVMIFTLAQWDLIKNDKMSVSAAPISPSLLGQNSKYVIALPARYNYDYKIGWEEVDQLVHTLKTFEPIK